MCIRDSNYNNTSKLIVCFRDKNGITIDARGVYMLVDSTGITDFKQNRKIAIILPKDLEYSSVIG